MEQNNFLHTHPLKETQLGLDKDHVIVDRADLLKATSPFPPDALVEADSVCTKATTTSELTIEDIKSALKTLKEKEPQKALILLPSGAGFDIYSTSVKTAKATLNLDRYLFDPQVLAPEQALGGKG